ncbi:MAG: hypothetical protein M3Y49_18610, partial [Actinomycetota bacterium]|nr:hypothetical protein [Actinomycetota bacterium]
VIQRLSNTPMADRMKDGKDLGEELVIAHAVAQAEAGAAVVMLIDEIRGAAVATREIGRLERLAAAGQPVGTLSLYSTLTVLKLGIGLRLIPDRNTMRNVHALLRGCDDGLVHIDQTDLLSHRSWKRPQPR